MEKEGSTFLVPLTTIVEVKEHPNADKLEIARVFDFDVIIGKGQYNVGDAVLYIPVDSILPGFIEEQVFATSKVKLNKSRVRATKIRGVVSHGLLVNISFLFDKGLNLGSVQVGKDYKELLGITKYQPPEDQNNGPRSPTLRNKPKENPYFRKYNGIDNIKWYPDAFKETDEVVIQTKLHGTHVRFGKAPFVANTLWKRILKFFKLTPKYEFVYGSNNVELTNRKNFKGFYGEDIYGMCLKDYEAESKLKNGEFIHAEIVGPGIQKNYTYGYKKHVLVIFDVRVMQEDGTQKWLNPEECQAFAKERGFNFVPVLSVGPFNKQILAACTTGNDESDRGEVREGCVVKSRFNYDLSGNKNCFKSINPAYLLDHSNTDNH